MGNSGGTGAKGVAGPRGLRLQGSILYQTPMATQRGIDHLRNEHREQRGKLCIIPAEVLFEPCYETGKSVRWAIRRADGKPMGIAGLWERKADEAGELHWSMTMLTINADGHPLMQRFHKPGDEKRSVVILPDEAWGDWLRAKSESAARTFFRGFDSGAFVAEPAPR